MRLDTALEQLRRDHRPISVPYVLVDRARRRTLIPLVEALRDAGASAIELGFPFSDPIADGPTLAAAHAAALEHGTRWADLLDAVRVVGDRLPCAVMTYANPVWHRSLDVALRELSQAGASGLIVPDLSLEESAPWSRAAGRRGIQLVLLAAPGTPPARVASIARASRGFLYLVSRYGTTGAGSPAASQELVRIVRTAHRAEPRRPVLVGFGIRDRATAERARASGADGVIVGTALEERIARGETPAQIGTWFRAVARDGATFHQ